MSNHFQMSLQRQHLILLSYLKTLRNGPAGDEPMTSRSTDWHSPNRANQGEVKFITNPPKKTCMQATKTITGFLSLVFL